MASWHYDRNHTWKFAPLVYCLLAIASGGLLAIAFASQPPANESLNTWSYLAVQIMVALLTIAVWAIALRAAIRFKQYAHTIKNSQDGESLNYLANGLILLVIYIIALCLGGSLMHQAHGSSYIRLAVGIQNYVPLVVALISMILMYLGSRHLAHLVLQPGRNRVEEIWRYLVPFALFSALFLVIFYTNAATLTGEYGVPRFIGAMPILLGTYALPYVVVWALGLLACLNLAWYTFHTEGSIYKHIFRNLHTGVLIVLFSIFLAQVLLAAPLSLMAEQIGMTAVFAVLLMAIYGFILVDRGTQKLERLETVG